MSSPCHVSGLACIRKFVFGVVSTAYLRVLRANISRVRSTALAGTVPTLLTSSLHNCSCHNSNCSCHVKREWCTHAQAPCEHRGARFLLRYGSSFAILETLPFRLEVEKLFTVKSEERRRALGRALLQLRPQVPRAAATSLAPQPPDATIGACKSACRRRLAFVAIYTRDPSSAAGAWCWDGEDGLVAFIRRLALAWPLLVRLRSGAQDRLSSAEARRPARETRGRQLGDATAGGAQPTSTSYTSYAASLAPVAPCRQARPRASCSAKTRDAKGRRRAVFAHDAWRVRGSAHETAQCDLARRRLRTHPDDVRERAACERRHPPQQHRMAQALARAAGSTPPTTLLPRVHVTRAAHGLSTGRRDAQSDRERRCGTRHQSSFGFGTRL